MILEVVIQQIQLKELKIHDFEKLLNIILVELLNLDLKKELTFLIKKNGILEVQVL
jgi:hypothetical protein